MDNFKYELRKGSKKERCPNCERKTFKPYIDKITGREAGEKYGICDRINSCAYRLYPKFQSDKDWVAPPTAPYVAPKPTEYIDKSIIEATFNELKSNVFFMYLVKIFGKEIAFELKCKYNIGTAKYGGTIFWQQDNFNRFRTGKVMYYHTNGKRDKERKSWFCHSKIRADFNYQQCFFGLHLVDGTKPVALCESEKTAVLMSVYMPDFIWIASGGSEMLNTQRLSELKRLDKVFPDGGQFEKWEMKTKLFENRQMDVSVENAIKSGEIPEGSDILDLIQAKL